MPEDSKKHQKSKNDPKDQRKRRGRQPAPGTDRNVEKELDVPKSSDLQAPEKQQKSSTEPPPEFYKNLKRETEDIIKITEEANSKYKKKEILSNWSKYEIPVESYDEIDEQENLGADYETLASAPLAVGSHFQFKHEKSWDTNTGPSVYDKYFEINMQSLNTALSTIPFYERNNIEVSLFSDTDIQNMNQRATKFKQKYFKDKNFTTPELEAQEKILNILSQGDDSVKKELNKEREMKLETKEYTILESDTRTLTESHKADSNIINDHVSDKTTDIVSTKEAIKLYHDVDNSKTDIKTSVQSKEEANEEHIPKPHTKQDMFEENILYESNVKDKNKISCEEVVSQLDQIELAPGSKTYKAPSEPEKNPAIESPEDLEKWLDDFLEG